MDNYVDIRWVDTEELKIDLSPHSWTNKTHKVAERELRKPSKLSNKSVSNTCLFCRKCIFWKLPSSNFIIVSSLQNQLWYGWTLYRKNNLKYVIGIVYLATINFNFSHMYVTWRIDSLIWKQSWRVPFSKMSLFLNFILNYAIIVPRLKIFQLFHKFSLSGYYVTNSS